MHGLVCTVALGGTAAGCFASGGAAYQVSYRSSSTAVVHASAPDLVMVRPGVQVVADYDEPVFFADGFYWRYQTGSWYRSSSYYTGWVYFASPPVVVLQIEQPATYVHYVPSGYVVHHTEPYWPPEPIVIERDHRSDPEDSATVVVNQTTIVNHGDTIVNHGDTVVNHGDTVVNHGDTVYESPPDDDDHTRDHGDEPEVRDHRDHRD